MISVHFQGKPFNITVIQVYAPTSNAKEAEVERFCEDLQDLLELTPKKDVLFIIGDWNAKGHLFWVLVLKGLVGLHRTVQLQLLYVILSLSPSLDLRLSPAFHLDHQGLLSSS